MVSSKLKAKFQLIAMKHKVPEFGLPTLVMIKRILKNSNLSKEEEEVLKQMCDEIDIDYFELKNLVKEEKDEKAKK